MYRTASTGSILEENVIKGGPHYIVSEGGVKGIGLAGSFSVLEEHEFRHVDVRHDGPNTTKSSVRDPAIWIY